MVLHIPVKVIVHTTYSFIGSLFEEQGIQRRRLGRVPHGITPCLRLLGCLDSVVSGHLHVILIGNDLV